MFVKPLVNLIWLAGLVFLLGSLDHALARRARGTSPRRAVRHRPSSRAACSRVSLALVLAAALAVACVLGAALPFLRDPEAADDTLDSLGAGGARSLLAFAEERDRALTALKELEADHRAGRVNDIDYRSAVGHAARQRQRLRLRALDDARAGGVSDAEAKIRR